MNQLMNDLLIERFKENISPAFWKKKLHFTRHFAWQTNRQTDTTSYRMRGRIRKHISNHDVWEVKEVLIQWYIYGITLSIFCILFRLIFGHELMLGINLPCNAKDCDESWSPTISPSNGPNEFTDPEPLKPSHDRFIT